MVHRRCPQNIKHRFFANPDYFSFPQRRVDSITRVPLRENQADSAGRAMQCHNKTPRDGPCSDAIDFRHDSQTVMQLSRYEINLPLTRGNPYNSYLDSKCGLNPNKRERVDPLPPYLDSNLIQNPNLNQNFDHPIALFGFKSEWLITITSHP